MAIDARIVLGGRNQTGLAQALESGREDKRQRELFNLAKQDREDAKVAGAEKARIDAEDRQRRIKQEDLEAEDKERLRVAQSIGLAARRVRPFLDKPETVPQAIKMLEQRVKDLIDDGRDPIDTLEALNLMRSGKVDQAKLLLKQADDAAVSLGALEPLGGGGTADLKTFQGMTAGLAPSEVEQARRINLGLDPRAGTTSSLERRSRDPSLSSAVIGQQAEESAAKETGKLAAQLKLKPEVDAAVNSAVAKATLAADETAENRSNQRALQIYDVAVKNLAESLGGTATGPVTGLMPAITSNQQIADGAVAAIAPVLKQLFRSAGEGIFTDKDQELLLAMVPTRTDTPDARAAKLLNIDAIVRAKLTPLGGPQDDESRLKALGF